jgi:hypothetical protein
MKDSKKMSYPKAKLVDGYFQWVTQSFEKHQEDPYEDFYQEKTCLLCFRKKDQRRPLAMSMAMG